MSEWKDRRKDTPEIGYGLLNKEFPDLLSSRQLLLGWKNGDIELGYVEAAPSYDDWEQLWWFDGMNGDPDYWMEIPELPKGDDTY